MLNEELIKELDSIQNGLNLDFDQKLVYSIAESYGSNACYDCMRSCDGTCEGYCATFESRPSCQHCLGGCGVPCSGTCYYTAYR